MSYLLAGLSGSVELGEATLPSFPPAAKPTRGWTGRQTVPALRGLSFRDRGSSTAVRSGMARYPCAGRGEHLSGGFLAS